MSPIINTARSSKHASPQLKRLLVTYFTPSPLKCSYSIISQFSIWRGSCPGCGRALCTTTEKQCVNDTTLTFWSCSLKRDAAWRRFHRKRDEGMCAVFGADETQKIHQTKQFIRSFTEYYSPIIIIIINVHTHTHTHGSKESSMTHQQ